MGLTFNLGRISPSVFTDASNNIGIGGSPSGSYKLEVTGTGRFSGELSTTSGLLSISGAGGGPPTGGVGFRFVSNRLIVYGGSSDITFQKNSNAGANMTILESGNIGIGNSSPNYKLDIYGGVSGTRTDVYIANAAGNYNIGVLSDNNGFASSTNSMLFYTAGTERMRITSGGTLNYNITTNSDVADQYHPGISFALANGGTLYQANNTTANVIITRFANPNGNVGSITTSGVSTSYNPSSDRRLKENIKPIENAIEKVLKLKPVSYTWIKTGESDDGFIAQDLLEIDYFKHRVNPIGEAEDGTDLYGVDYMRFVSILTAAIQEQQIQIQELSAQNQDLKSRLDKAGL